MSTDDLLAYLFDGQPNLLFEPMAGVGRLFAPLCRLRHHLSGQNPQEAAHYLTPQKSFLDLQLELETAYLLLDAVLAWCMNQSYPAASANPDFAVSYTTSLTFMLEVTRVQANPEENAARAPGRYNFSQGCIVLAANGVIS